MASQAWWALRFTPRVVVVDAEAVLLEVSGSERLWGGREALHAQVLSAWALAAAAAQAHSVVPVVQPPPHRPVPVHGCAPTALLALARLRRASAGPQQGHTGHEDPATLPLHTLTALRPFLGSLERMGCRTWGALRALPRAGVSRRWGAGVLLALDQAYGDAPESYPWLELPEQFALALELPALVDNANALLWSAQRALAALQGWLQGRQLGALAVELGWRHDVRRVDGVAIAPTQALAVRTAEPTQDLAHLRRLLAEKLARTTLAAPANQITLRLLESAPLALRSASLLPPEGFASRGSGPGPGGPEGAGEGLQQLLERLSARLGADRVLAPVLQADHRPERMQQWQPAAAVRGGLRVGQPPSAGGLQGGRASAAWAGGATVPGAPHVPDAALWPTWLVNPPRRLAVQGSRPCYEGVLRLLAGPHRFEAGWWSAPDGPGPENGTGAPRTPSDTTWDAAAGAPFAASTAGHAAAPSERPSAVSGQGRGHAGPGAGGVVGDSSRSRPRPSPQGAGQGLVLRDYFVAYNAVAGMVWVFREHLAPVAGATSAAAAPPEQRWFLHGIFG